MKFVFDLDGTICFKGQPVSEKILSALSKLTDQGHEVIFASARPIRDILPILREDWWQALGKFSYSNSNRKNKKDTKTRSKISIAGN